MARQSLYHEYPDYRVDLEPAEGRVTVRLAGELIASSQKTLTVRETKHAEVTYFPREDVRLEKLERTDHQTHCPFKGDASYWTIRAGEAVCENAVWSYESPFPEVEGLRDYMAFYVDRVDWERE